MQNEIQVGRYSGLLHKLLDMKEGAPAPTLATDIFPTLALEVERPEWAFLAGDRLAQASLSQAGVAGENATLALVNPLNSGMLLVFEKARVSAAATLNVYLYLTFTAPIGWTGVNLKSPRDSRWGSTALSGLTFTTSTVGTPVVLPVSYRQLVVQNVSTVFDQPVVLAPDSALLFYSDGANQTLTAGLEWRERAILASETR